MCHHDIRKRKDTMTNLEYRRIYLDNAATTPMMPGVLAAMEPYLTSDYGNANALYREGVIARQALEGARETIAEAIGASPTEVVFTSGGTEADNAAINGITAVMRQKYGRIKAGNHLICSAFEHHAVLESIKSRKQDGFLVTQVKPRRDGFIHLQDLQAVLTEQTMLVSVMTAQNEIGTVQPVRELANLTHQVKSLNPTGVLFHTDAVQALGKIPFNVREAGVDAASFSAHKIGGPKGIGALYLCRQTPFIAQIRGGGQELGRRSGTQNVAAAVGFAKALELTLERQQHEMNRLAQLRDLLAAELLSLDRRISLSVPIDPTRHLPGLLAVTVQGLESGTLILHLDDAGIAVSGGSACSTGSLQPSHVLTAIGMSRSLALGALRFSLGSATTEADIPIVKAALARILNHG